MTTRTRIAEAIDGYDTVFTTNYDLTVYWSFIQELENAVQVADLFWGPAGTFDRRRTDVWSGWTGLYYLHGAIHLWQDTDGVNGKWAHADGGRLLDLARQYTPSSSRRPLFVSEGISQKKMLAIRSSAYLTHCYETFENDRNNTVVLGHSLSEGDMHIIEALRQGPDRHIAVSVYPHQRGEDIVQTKARITAALDPHTVSFFDSETHPLGDPVLNVG